MRNFKNKPSPLASSVATALLSIGLVTSSFAGEPSPEPNTYTDVLVPTLSGWNTDNIFTLDEGVDGFTGATPRSYIHPSKELRDQDVANFEFYHGPDSSWAPNSVAAVFWELDNGSGRAPGLQVVTDDLDFPTNNCVMASGEIESADHPGTILPKTCSDAEGSSKRYFLELTKSDVPVDIAFNLGAKEIRYKGVKNPSTDEGAELKEFRDSYGIGRIYRVIQKVINNTDKRIASYKFELGTGIGDAFQPLTFEENGVAFEMRKLVPREFFEGETGAPDIKVWNPQRFATVSPKMFDDGSRDRFEPGFLDNAAAGFLPPQFPVEGVEKSQSVDSGLTIVDGKIGSLTPNYFDITNTQGAGIALPGNLLGYQLPDSLIPTVIGEYNTNEVGGESDAIVAMWDGTDWRSGRAGLDGDLLTTEDSFAVIPVDQLKQWAAKPLGLNIPGELEEDVVRYEALPSDDLSGLNTDVYIYIGDKLLNDSNELTIDSITLRVTANSVEAVIGDVAGGEDPAWVEAGKEAPALASYMTPTGIPVAINDITTTVETKPVTLSVLDNDMLDGVILTPEQVSAATTTVAITAAAAHGNAVVNADKNIEYTAADGFVGTDRISYTVTVDGNVSNVATIKVVVDAIPLPELPVANNDSATTFKDVNATLNVLENDELNKVSPASVVVSVNNAPLTGSATVSADNAVVYTPQAGFVGLDRFTYVVTVDGKVSNSALITIRIDEPVIATATGAKDDEVESSSTGGCSVGRADGPFDPILPGMLVLALAGLVLRRKKQSL
ncbi:Uncharacterised protein [BD1-7 clade bacterium]|uniref:Cadherin-like domain-containing protein n=1 Tax=BD1-7 clade bacterium TaxID=2029982 RepID=A0A5S9QEL2_9GAMM|nr:Uncharacterised protein [BD1-7 clade bacterium]